MLQLFMRMDPPRFFTMWGFAIGVFILGFFLLRNNKRLHGGLFVTYVLLSRLHIYQYEEPRSQFDIGPNFDFFLKVNFEAFIVFLIMLIYWIVTKIKAKKLRDKDKQFNVPDK